MYTIMCKTNHRLCKNLQTGPGALTDYTSASQVLIHLMWLQWKPAAPWALRTWMFLAQWRKAQTMPELGITLTLGAKQRTAIARICGPFPSCTFILSHATMRESFSVLLLVLIPRDCLFELGLVYMALNLSSFSSSLKVNKRKRKLAH